MPDRLSLGEKGRVDAEYRCLKPRVFPLDFN